MKEKTFTEQVQSLEDVAKYTKWKTAEGTILNIVDMDYEHLMNCYNLTRRRILSIEEKLLTVPRDRSLSSTEKKKEMVNMTFSLESLSGVLNALEYEINRRNMKTPGELI